MKLFRKRSFDFATLPKSYYPKHIGVIMDGNGRWAKKRGLPRMAGHAAGAKTFKTIARYGNKLGIEVMTNYAFSTENWKRPPEEVDSIMKLLREYLEDVDNYKHENIRLRFIGDRESLPGDIQDLMRHAEETSITATGMTLNLAVNYGGRPELVKAFHDIADDVVKRKVDRDSIDEKLIDSYLYTAGQPDPDLIIRPSGEYRLSNFMIWQAAYSEFWYSNILWPDFKERDLEQAILDYARRNRRFGGV